MSFLLVFIYASAQVKHSDWFTDNSLRLDYYHAGNFESEHIFFKELRKEQYWGGPLWSPFKYGQYYVKVYDKKTGNPIFSYGFCSLFEEWQHTDEAKSMSKAFPESVIIPFPKNEITLEIHSRQYNDNSFKKIYELDINPNDVFINKEQTVSAEVIKIHYSQTSDKALDLVFISDGYTKDELSGFYEDVRETADYLFSIPPFKEKKNQINIWAVGAVSPESGTDVPQNNIWKSTSLNSNFNTFGSERYLTSSDYHSIRNYAALAPCDQICIFVNTDIYGGGGIYNFWNITSAKNQYRNEVFAHELGHSLAALGDEYYDSEVAIEGFFNKSIEPYQANITTLIDFDSKWKNMMLPDTKIPTEQSIENIKLIGVYEGAGYQAKGIYRPYMNCKMKALGFDFCPVCQKALSDIIDNYSNY